MTYHDPGVLCQIIIHTMYKNSKQGIFSCTLTLRCLSNDPEEGFISIDNFFFFCLQENPNLRYTNPQLFAQEATNLSTNDNTSVKDNNCFISFELKMPSVNTPKMMILFKILNRKSP